MGVLLTTSGLPLLAVGGLVAVRKVSPILPEATVEFGALTLAGAGGEPAPDGVTSITGGTATGYTLSGGVVAPTSTGSADSGTIIFDTSTFWQVSTLANEYSVSTVAEAEAVNALGTATLEGKTRRWRPGTYDVVGSAWLTNRAFTTGFTDASHDDPAFPGILEDENEESVESHARVKIIIQKDLSQNDYSGMENITFDGPCFEGLFDRLNQGINNYLFPLLSGPITNVTFRNIWGKGDNDVLGDGPSFYGLVGGAQQYLGASGFKVENSRLSHMTRGLNVNRPGRLEVVGCQIDDYGLDGIIAGRAGEKIIRDNFFHTPASDRTMVHWKGAAKASTDGSVTGVSDGLTGLAHFCIRPNQLGQRQVILADQPLGGTMYAAMEITSGNKFYFWAADATGVKRVELTSTISAVAIRHNILVSVDNGVGQTSRMHIWQSGGKQGRAATSETVTDTGTGEALNWDAGGMALAADNSDSDGANHYNGLLSRFAFWPGVTADVSNPAVQANFFVDDPSGAIVFADVYGTPPLDVVGTLHQWRGSNAGGPAVNSGTGEGFHLRTADNSVDTGHVDAAQFVTNVSGAGDQDAGGPIWIENNVVFGWGLDGQPVSGGGQAFHLSDIMAGWVHDRVRVHGNLCVFSGPEGILIANPTDARVAHNTLVTPHEFRNGVLTDNQELLDMRFLAHETGTGSPTRSRDLASGYMRSNLGHNAFTVEASISPYLDSPDTHPITAENVTLPADLTGILGDYFKGTVGDGTGFEFTSLTSRDRLRAMFATADSLNPAGCIRQGFDAYPAGERPWDGTCDAFTVPSAVPGESAFVVPSNVSAGGIAVYADVPVRLYGPMDTPLSDWQSTRALHLTAGQKFKCDSTAAGTGSYTVNAGNQSATWTVAGDDVTAPELSSPSDAASGATTATGSVSTTEGNGTLYAVVVPGGDTNPTALEVEAGHRSGGSPASWAGSQAVITTDAQTLSPSPSGLSGSTAYKIAYAQRDQAGNLSNVAVADGFTTSDLGTFDGLQPATSSLPYRGVTINLSTALPYFWSANGDPVFYTGGASSSITSFSPASTSDGTYQHSGVMKNPSPAVNRQSSTKFCGTYTQGFDRRFENASTQFIPYISTLNLDPNAHGNGALSVPQGSSFTLVKQVRAATVGNHVSTDRYVVFTFMGTLPPGAGTWFRPGISTQTKSGYPGRLEDMNWGALRDLSRPSGLSTASTYLSEISSRKIHTIAVFVNNYCGVRAQFVNEPPTSGYSRDYGRPRGRYACALHVDPGADETPRRDLAKILVTWGIDVDSVVQSGYVFGKGAGHHHGFIEFPFIAAFLLNDADMLGRAQSIVANSIHQQCWIKSADIGKTVKWDWGSTSGTRKIAGETYQATDLNVPEWAIGGRDTIDMSNNLHTSYRDVHIGNIIYELMPVALLRNGPSGATGDVALRNGPNNTTNDRAAALAYMDRQATFTPWIKSNTHDNTAINVWNDWRDEFAATTPKWTGRPDVPANPVDEPSSGNRQIHVSGLSSGQIGFRFGGWMPSNYSTLTVDDREMQVSLDNRQFVDVETIDAGNTIGTTASGTLSGFRPGTVHYCRWRQHNSAGWSRWTASWEMSLSSGNDSAVYKTPRNRVTTPGSSSIGGALSQVAAPAILYKPYPNHEMPLYEACPSPATGVGTLYCGTGYWQNGTGAISITAYLWEQSDNGTSGWASVGTGSSLSTSGRSGKFIRCRPTIGGSARTSNVVSIP